MTLSIWQLPFRGQSFFFRQLQRFSVALGWALMILLLWPLIIDPIFSMQLYDTFTFCLLKILCRGEDLGKCLLINFRKVWATFVLIFWLKGGLNHMMFRGRFLLFLSLVVGGSYFNSLLYPLELSASL